VCLPDLETALRRLRAYPFLHREVRIEIAPSADSLDLVIHTRDAWSTRPLLTFRKEGGLWTWSAGVRESNLLGLGKALTMEVSHEENQDYWVCGYADRQLLGREVGLLLTLAHGSELGREYFVLQRAFSRPQTMWGFTAQADAYRGDIVDHRGGLDGPEWRTDAWRVSLYGGPRVIGGPTHALRLLPGLHFLRERYEQEEDDLPAGTPHCAPGASDPLRARDIRAVGVTVDWVREAYTRRRGIDVLGLWEDVNLGTEMQLLVSYSSQRLGAAAEGTYLDLRAQQGMDGGRRAFALFTANGYGQVVSGALRDALLELVCRGYASLPARQTLALRLQTDLGWELAPQDLPTLGAERGLRGFDAYRFWGERSALASLEDRLFLFDDLMGILSLGVAAFVDAGTTWNPGCEDAAKVRLSAGVGLRLLGTRTTGRLVTRIDLGYPLKGSEEGDGWVVSVAAGQAF
jgi:hypothetical protein